MKQKQFHIHLLLQYDRISQCCLHNQVLHKHHRMHSTNQGTSSCLNPNLMIHGPKFCSTLKIKMTKITALTFPEIFLKKSTTDCAEEVNLIHVPKADQFNTQYLLAKQEELQKLKDFNTYEEVKSRFQQLGFLWKQFKKVDCASSYRLLPQNSGKSRLQILTSAFPQGKPLTRLTREVYIQPSKEAQLERVMIWKLRYCLTDATLAVL